VSDTADPHVDFQTEPERYKHWKLSIDGQVATLTLDVDEQGGLFRGCELKLNSYDLSVDIEFSDAVQRLRFEQPQVGAVVVRSGKERVFCAGANIRMLASASHRHKVNFCKFTNETRNAIEDASAFSGQQYICVVTGTAAGGGYELALAMDEIILIDDGSSAVGLPEVPLLAVLPGTGGLTRLTDKRKIRRDHADVFCTIEEGIKGQRALQWRLVDYLVPRSQLEAVVGERVAARLVATANDPASEGILLAPLVRDLADEHVRYSSVDVALDRAGRTATITVHGPSAVPADATALHVEGADAWALRCARELDDAILHLRFNEPELGVLVLKTIGDPTTVLAYDRFLGDHASDWFVHEIRLLWKRVFKRIDVTSRSLVALIEQGSCFAGTLAEFAFVADRSYMLAEDSATLTLSSANDGWYPMANGLSRLETRFLGDSGALANARIAAAEGDRLDAESAARLGLVTFALDDIDYADEVRVFLEERASFSPDALTGMEANLRFAGPETLESKIFARLTAWQNWIFQRPNAVGPDGALKRYGTGQKAEFDPSRV
jgi:benzoyl-CoA-dihydrodiol lyase